jgi:hypothetical protein
MQAGGGKCIYKRRNEGEELHLELSQVEADSFLRLVSSVHAGDQFNVTLIRCQILAQRKSIRCNANPTQSHIHPHG